MKIRDEIKTITTQVYIANDGKEFQSKKSM